MIWHKNIAALFLILLFGATAFTSPSWGDNFPPSDGAPKSSHHEENTSPSITAEQISQQLIRLPWKKSPPPPHHEQLPPPGHISPPYKAPWWKPWKKSPPLPPHGHLPPPAHKPPPKAPWWKPWKKSPPKPKPPHRPWWKQPCCGRKKSPPPPVF